MSDRQEAADGGRTLFLPGLLLSLLWHSNSICNIAREDSPANSAGQSTENPTAAYNIHPLQYIIGSFAFIFKVLEDVKVEDTDLLKGKPAACQ